ncbi:MAG TPA: molybdopterin-binding protein [Synergistaceae bacterium]|nr:molybdopterin-binding protein [Synergistaceae bacterium]HPJ24593.1 molybdopterin-binding protein [Synergistaceae bacterium]HPQ38276.1 molybdopterin-binding protein [Synergistaceae bacterium]
MKIEAVPVEHAIGRTLAHDLTLIDPESGFKGARFFRGHRIRSEDVPLLKRMGKSNISFIDMAPDEVHEDEAALRLGERLRGKGVSLQGPEEGKCSLKALHKGLLVYSDSHVDFVNSDPEWLLATLPNKVRVLQGETVAAFRVGPLVVKEEQVARAETVDSISVLPWLPLKVALVTTGREIYEGIVNDAFQPKLLKKIAEYGGTLLGSSLVPDEKISIREAVLHWLSQGAKVVLCTGGMSVDADDVTPSAIRSLCDKEIFRRVPTIPGTNLMLATRGDSFLLGVPAAAAFKEITSLDMVLDRIFAGVPPTEEEVRLWGRGGLCRNCISCGYPRCAFSAR